nr:reverse transcriptase domain, reverse transcriptase zinc-binding domain protein [Tanacetum cinerariifolium]
MYKEYHEVENKSNGIFHFGKGKETEGDSDICIVNMEQVKEIGEMIGVSWARAVEKGQKDVGWGILLMWDTRIFVCKEAVGDERFIAIKGSWKGSKRGRKFTRVSDDGLKFSKLDRFMLNEKFNELWGNLSNWSFLESLRKLEGKSKERFGGHKEKVETLRNEAMRWELEAESRILTKSDVVLVRGSETMGGERKRAWGCNACFVPIIPKGADPIGLGDFRPICLIGCYYKIIAKLLAERVKRVAGSMVGEVQNAFIKGRYILDGVLIANETMDFLRKKKKKGLIFKVDFEKAYDSLNSRFILDIMKKMGFGERWCKWVESCLRSSSMSILVNGSPSEEFAVDKGIFKGVFVSDDKVTVSHLQYADDTIFFGKWNKENAKSLMCILKCFEEVSCLRMNYNKSKLYGIGVNEREMAEMARWMGCGIGEFPFAYLGLPIGGNMRRIKAWDSVEEKFKNRLADWKAKMISFGGRLTLVKSKKLLLGRVGECKKLSWVKWDSVINSFGEGGFNIGSLRAKNLALLGKWLWRFKREGRSLWVRVIKSIHGSSGSLGDGGMWVGIGTRKVMCGIKGCGKVMSGVGNGIGLETLKRWMLGEDGEFTVKELSILIEHKVLSVESGMHETLWNKLAPKKVNIFVWKALRGRLPVRVELDRREIDLDTVLCPCCNNIMETCPRILVI